jgi:endoglucanase
MLPPKHLGRITRNTAIAAVKRLVVISTGLLFSLAAGSALLHAQSVSGLKVQDRSHDNDDVDNQLYADYEIDNTGTGTVPTAVPLSTLTMRYWFTNETPSDPLVFSCDYAQISCANITSKFVTLTTPAALATTYLELDFTAAAGSIQPGQNSGEIQTRIHHENYSNFLTEQTYSFISDDSFVYKDTTTVTLYLNGVLVWGVEPQ